MASFILPVFKSSDVKAWEASNFVVSEKIELIVPERREELIADLKERVGVDVIRVEVRRIDLLRDTANLRIFYYEQDSE